MKYIILIIVFIFSACSDESQKEINNKNIIQQETKTIEISSVKEIEQLFVDLNYTSSAWQHGNYKVPRIYFDTISKDWKHTSNTITVKEKKNIFFRLIAPLILLSNEDITRERKQLLKDTKDSSFSIELAKKYRILKKEENTLSDAQFLELKKRVDIIPLSLALAQGAEESGWGTSRFASEGNALFGQWDFSGKGMSPKHQRKELGNYGLARFNTPLDSVKGYMLNLNTTRAYKKLRTLRQKLRDNNKTITGYKLANTLDKYSERGQAYIDGLHTMMRYNKLLDVDKAYLAKGPRIRIVKKEED